MVVRGFAGAKIELGEGKSKVTATSDAMGGFLLPVDKRYVADNPKGGNKDHYFPYVRLSPNGDINIKADEWQQLPFTVKVLKRDSETAAMYIDGRPQ